MENQELDNHLKNDDSFDDEIKNYLLSAAKWAKFIAIAGFIFIGLIIWSFLRTYYQFLNLPVEVPNEIYLRVFLIFVILTIIVYLPTRFLYNFSSNILQNHDTAFESNESLKEGLKHLNYYFTTIGILTILYSLYFVYTFWLSLNVNG
jgi:hypothetical protein